MDMRGVGVMTSNNLTKLAYTPGSAAEALNVSRAHIHKEITAGRITGVKKISRRKTLIPVESLRAWLEGFPTRHSVIQEQMSDEEFRVVTKKILDERQSLDRQMVHWQPMETAPKDGTRVMLAIEGQVFIGYYLESKNTTNGKVTWESNGWSTGAYTDIARKRGIEPDCWARIPAPPSPRRMPKSRAATEEELEKADGQEIQTR